MPFWYATVITLYVMGFAIAFVNVRRLILASLSLAADVVLDSSALFLGSEGQISERAIDEYLEKAGSLMPRDQYDDPTAAVERDLILIQSIGHSVSRAIDDTVTSRTARTRVYSAIARTKTIDATWWAGAGAATTLAASIIALFPPE